MVELVLAPPPLALSFSVTLYLCSHICLSVCLSAYNVSVCLYVCLWSIRLSVCGEQRRDGVCPDRGPPALSSPPSPGFPGHRLLEDIGQERQLISRGTARHDTHVENVAITTNHNWRFSTQLNFKGIVPYLIFWMVMGCGIARFDRGVYTPGPKT